MPTELLIYLIAESVSLILAAIYYGFHKDEPNGENTWGAVIVCLIFCGPILIPLLPFYYFGSYLKSRNKIKKLKDKIKNNSTYRGNE